MQLFEEHQAPPLCRPAMHYCTMPPVGRVVHGVWEQVHRYNCSRRPLWWRTYVCESTVQLIHFSSVFVTRTRTSFRRVELITALQ